MSKLPPSDSMSAQQNSPGYVAPFIPASTSLPEITLRAGVLSFILLLLLAGANAYLGLKIGITVSATIPAAVISMAVLRFFKNSNILENNIVQTAASAGEAIAGAVVFTMPALILMGFWQDIPFVTTALIVAIGGTLGALYTIPLRRAFIVESSLPFPEGVATGEVLKCGANDAKGSAKELLFGGLAAASVKFMQSGLYLFSDTVGAWGRKGRLVFGVQTGLDLVLVGAGYIIGISTAMTILLGAFFCWGIAVPIKSLVSGSDMSLGAQAAAMKIWGEDIRIIGVGTLVTSGLWTVVKLVEPLKRAIKSSIEALKKTSQQAGMAIIRTEKDIPITILVIGVFALLLPIVVIFNGLIADSGLDLTSTQHVALLVLISFFIIIFGFVVSALGGYLAGLVGASNSPLSAIVIMSIISVATMIVVVVGGDIAGTDPSTNRLLSASALTILVTAVMANTATLAIDNLQDLKSGQIVGATPWKQQVMLIGGVLVSALFISKILEILYSAYGFEGAMPRPDMNPENALAAPTASVMNKITSAVFSGSMNWQMFSIGVGIAFLFIIGEIWCKKTNRAYKMSPLAFSLGVYLPMHVAFPMFFGGLMGYLADRRLSKRRSQVGAGFEARADAARKRGLLFSSGLIAGEALIGIALAIPFAASQNTKLFDLRPENFDSIANFLGAGAFVAVALYLRHVSGTIRPLKET